MIYAQHNFAENFASAEGRKDEFMKEQIVIDELARLITTRKNDVVKLLRDNGINATFNDTTDRITELTLMLISQNDNFVLDLKKLILDNHKKIEGDTDYSLSASGLMQREYISKDSSKGLGAAIKKIGRIRNKSKFGKAKLYANADDLLRSRVKLADAKINIKEFPKWAKWTIIALSASALIIASIIIVRKFNKNSIQPMMQPIDNSSEVEQDENENYEG